MYNRDAGTLKFFGDTEAKIRRIDGDHDVGLCGADVGSRFSNPAQDFRNLRHHLGQAHDAEFVHREQAL